MTSQPRWRKPTITDGSRGRVSMAVAAAMCRSWWRVTGPISPAPGLYSLIVAILAGIVGVVSLTEARAAALIGVFISVTTIPAAADTGLSIAYAS